MSVDVVIPTYNHGHFIGEAIESALAQTVPPGRVIVVDDGSTDDTAEVVRRFPVEYVRQDNAGPAVARNHALRLSTAPWVVFLDADDLLDRRFIAWTLRAAAIPSVRRLAVVYTPAAHLTDHVEPGRTSPWELALLREFNYVHCTSLVSREALDDVGGFEPRLSRVGGEDWNLYLALAERGWHGRCLPVPLFTYRHHEGAHRNENLPESYPIIAELRPSISAPQRRSILQRATFKARRTALAAGLRAGRMVWRPPTPA